MINEDVKNYIYNEATSHADIICENIFPIIRQALMEAYAKGFNNATKK